MADNTEEEQGPEDKRIAALGQHLADAMMGADGNDADPQHIEEVVRAHAAQFRDAPIKDFVPLLVENRARDELHREGLRTRIPDEPEGPVVEHPDSGDEGDEGPPRAHLAPPR